MEISKNQVLKTAIQQVQERTGMSKDDVLKSIINDFGDSEKSGDVTLLDFLKSRQ